MKRRMNDIYLRLGITDDAVLAMEFEDAISLMQKTRDTSQLKAYATKASKSRGGANGRTL